MLYIRFLACTKVELWDLTVCTEVNGEKNLMLRCDLDLGPAMPNIELLQDIFIYYNIFQFHVARLINYFFSCHAKTRKHKHTHTQTLTNTL